MKRQAEALPLLPLGVTNITPGARAVLTGAAIWGVMDRHERNDWGDVDEEERMANEAGLKFGLPVISCYTLSCGRRIWVHTEADRAHTTVSLPDEY